VAQRVVQRHPGPLLADTAVRCPELTALAAPLVLTSAEAAWQGRTVIGDAADGGPVFAPDWRQPARTPRPGVPEVDLSVQLSAWMLLEAAARTASAADAPADSNPA
jgi:predicted alpha-1,6-mannanase (GH76 family)